MQARILFFLWLGLWSCWGIGCAVPDSVQTTARRVTASLRHAPSKSDDIAEQAVSTEDIRQVEFRQPADPNENNGDDGTPTPSVEPSVDGNVPEELLDEHADDALPRTPPPLPSETVELEELIQTAVNQNSRLVRLYRDYLAAAARSEYADKLPDPRFGANIFGDPIETAAGSQLANFTFSQTLPWLSRLSAEQQRACFEAFAVRAEYAAERLRVIAAVRTNWYRLYVIEKQIEITLANQELLQTLIDVANARIATGNATQGDVLLGTVELSQAEERLFTFRKQRRAVEAEINRLLSRPADTPVRSPEDIDVDAPEQTADTISQLALTSQPEIEAARIRTQATRWGIEVARLRRRPEFTLSASYFLTEANRPFSPFVKVGEDPWNVGVQVSLPIWHEDYEAMRNEAGWQHLAAQSSVEELADRYDALIVDLMAEARRAADTAVLYETTILPQARQTLVADQDAYTNGTVEFDRVIRDYRNLLTLELGYHAAIGELAIVNARLDEAAGGGLEGGGMKDEG